MCYDFITAEKRCSAKDSNLKVLTMQNANIVSFADRIATLNAHARAHDNDDLARVLGKSGKVTAFTFTEKTNDALNAMGVDTSVIFAPTAPVKAIMRFVQFVNAIHAKDYKAIDTTTATIIYALAYVGEMTLTRDALHYLGAGIKSGKTVETRGVSRTTANKLFGRVGLSTVPTQASRTVGKSGFLTLTGAVQTEGGQNARSKVVDNHPLIVAFHACMNQATEAQIDQMIGE